MRILILGGSGMLGHRLWLNLNQVHETWVTVRGDGSQLLDILGVSREYILPQVDALVLDQVTHAMASVRPHLVINCIGLVKQIPLADDPLASIAINALFPHQMASICKQAGIRMIHFSTDCVFSGKKGQYVEEDTPDAVDLYGRTKLLGEVTYPHTVTVRTSMIGRELRTRHGLVEWFLAQKGEVKGYTNAIFSGLTTDELSNILLRFVIPRPELTGMYHISGEPISKYDLLRLIKESFGLSVNVLPEEEPMIDRSLDSTRFRQATGYAPPTWRTMIAQLKEHSIHYDPMRG